MLILGLIILILGVALYFVIPWIGIVLAIIGIFFIFIGLAPSDYDDEEQLETEDEINLIYFDDE